MWSPKTKEDVATITLSFTMPMITKATADKRFSVVAMMRFKAKAFKAFRKITGQCAWLLAIHENPLKKRLADLAGLLEWGTTFSSASWIPIINMYDASIPHSISFPTKSQPVIIARKVFISAFLWFKCWWHKVIVVLFILYFCHVFIIVHLRCLTGRYLCSPFEHLLGGSKNRPCDTVP